MAVRPRGIWLRPTEASPTTAVGRRLNRSLNALIAALVHGVGRSVVSVSEVVMGKDKLVTVIVNGTPKEVAKEDLTYDEVVRLAFETPPYGENTLFSVSYVRGHGNKPEGVLAPGQSLKVKDGMIIDVTATDRS